MDYVDRMMGNRFSAASASTFLKFTALDRRVQLHLQKVYLTLSVSLAVAAAGCALDMALHIGGFITFFLSLGCMFGLQAYSATPANLLKRTALLAGFAFSQGCSLGPLVQMGASISSGLVFTAFAATAAIFVCFSLAALVTQRRSYLFLGGWLSSAMSMIMVVKLAGWLFGARAMVFNVELYLGLLVFSGYVLLDTQLIVEKASAGNFDHIRHALDLLVDVIAMFVRILIILIKNAEKQRQAEEKRKRRS
ncbi:MAG: hypothetical protein WDW38_002306 [Sanguina aurantia]